MKNTQKKFLSAVLAASSVAGVVAPAVTAFAATTTEVETLVANALKDKTFYSFNIAYGAIRSLPAADQGKYLSQIAPLETVVRTADIDGILRKIDTFYATQDMSVYNEVLYTLIPKVATQVDREYLQYELGKWGTEFIVKQQPEYITATDAIIAVDNALAAGKLDEAKALVPVAEGAIAKVKHVKNNEYLKVTTLPEVVARLDKAIIAVGVNVASVTAVNSQNMATDLNAMPVNGKIKITFSKKVNADTINVNTIRVFKVDGNIPVAIAAQDIKLASDGLSATIAVTNTQNYDKSTTYKVVVNGVKSDDLSSTISNKETTFKTSDVTVVSSLFGNNPSSVVANSTLSIVYDRDLSAASVTTNTVVITEVSTGKRIAASATVSGRNLNTTVGESLVVGKQYTISIKGLVSTNGSTVEDYDYTFNVGAVSPVVPSIVTLDNYAVSANTNVWPKLEAGVNLGNTWYAGVKFNMTFNTKLDAPTMADNIILVEKETGVVVPTTISYIADAKMVTLAPKADLKEATEYKVVFKKDLKSDLGVKTTYTTDQEIIFKTQDLVAPTVSSVTSVNGDFGLKVSEKQEFNVKFSEGMALNTNGIFVVDAATDLTNIGTAPKIAATVTAVNAAKGEYKISIAKSTLTTNKAYKIVVVGKDKEVTGVPAAVDNSGNNNKLQSTFVYSFTTEGADVTAPVVTKVYKGDSIADADVITTKANVVAGNKFTIMFDENIVLTNATVKLQYFKDGNWDTVNAINVTNSVSSKDLKALLVTVPTLTTNFADAKVRFVVEKVQDGLTNETKTPYYFEVVTTAGDDTAPTAKVTDKTPADNTAVIGAELPNATLVAIDSKLVLEFAETDLADVTVSNVEVKDAAGTVVDGKLEQVEGTTNKFLLTPSAKLANDTIYTVTVSGVKDIVGNDVAKKIVSFKTVAADAVISSNDITDGQTNVDRNKTISVVFSKAVNTYTTKTVAIFNVDDDVATATPVATATLQSDNKTFKFIQPSLASLTEYKLVVKSGSGASLTVDKSFKFITGTTASDDIKPTLSNVSGVAIANSTVELAADTSALTLAFSENLKTSGATVTIQDLTADKAVGVLPLVYSGSTITVSTATALDVNQDLPTDAASHTYKVTITGAKDSAGNVADDIVIYVK